jgi:hypothetical protein
MDFLDYLHSPAQNLSHSLGIWLIGHENWEPHLPWSLALASRELCGSLLQTTPTTPNTNALMHGEGLHSGHHRHGIRWGTQHLQIYRFYPPANVYIAIENGHL